MEIMITKKNDPVHFSKDHKVTQNTIYHACLRLTVFCVSFIWCLKLTDPPEEIKRNGIKTIMYLRNILRRSEGYYTIKLMLVGKAAQGKTTLKHRLMKDYNYNFNKSTNGRKYFLSPYM